MYTTNIVKLVACLAWAGVAVSSATPADAKATTTQSPGQYGTCSNNSSTTSYWCGSEMYNYAQRIKMLQSGCSTGQCGSVLESTYVDFLYGAGRKIVVGAGQCATGYYSFQMGTCAC